MEAAIPIPFEALTTFCQKWRVNEMSLFGSALRSDFGPESDIDLLVRFDDNAGWTYWDYPDMTDELQRMFGRPIDLVEERALDNPFRRHRILTTRRMIYAA